MSERQLAARMKFIDRSPADLDAVFLTHEHSDHVRGVGPLLRKYGITLFTTEGTFKRSQHIFGDIPKWKKIQADEPIGFSGMTVEPYSTPHDAEESVAFVVRNATVKLGHATDLGTVTPEVKEKLKGADALLVEANHDVNMLEVGPYPWPVKQRIKSDAGHLSNEACGELLSAVGHRKLKRVVLMHLSMTNNHPDIAHITARQALGDHPAEILLARQDSPIPLIEV